MPVTLPKKEKQALRKKMKEKVEKEAKKPLESKPLLENVKEGYKKKIEESKKYQVPKTQDPEEMKILKIQEPEEIHRNYKIGNLFEYERYGVPAMSMDIEKYNKPMYKDISEDQGIKTDDKNYKKSKNDIKKAKEELDRKRKYKF